MLITKRNQKKTFLLLCFIVLFFLFVFFFDPGRGCLFSSAPLSSLVIPRKKQHRGPFYDNLPPPARLGAPENFGQSQILLENIAYYDHSPVNFAKSSFFTKKIAEIYERGFRTSPNNSSTIHATSPKTPIFPAFFATTAPRRPCKWKSKQAPQAHQFYFFRPDNPHLKCNQTGNTRAVISTKTTFEFQQCTQVIAQNPYFFSANQYVDNELTSTWTTS